MLSPSCRAGVAAVAALSRRCHGDGGRMLRAGAGTAAKTAAKDAAVAIGG
ncbi:hypothetical protein JNB63_08355 [Microbacterium trichothecenolyticum]|nr:hypothetical protein [Microbacterium trichothecenolyticum]MBW9120102.1 hypothetical protein [Microbacterium trichothecenolyticum]